MFSLLLCRSVGGYFSWKKNSCLSMKKKRLGWLLLWWKRTGEMRIYGRTTWSSLVWSPIYVCHHVFSFGIQSLMHHWFLGICPIKSIQKDWHLSMEVLLGTTSWKLELLEVLLRIFFSTLATSTDVAPPWPPPVSPKKYQSESTHMYLDLKWGFLV